jgi:ADP-ribose pyrophosphatase YjhB (NUDIX family)
MNQPLSFERPLTTVDIAIFGVREGALHVLLVRRQEAADEPYPGQWALPGGFVDVAQDRDLHACALRKLREKTGVAAPYLEQLGSWGSATRDPRGWAATHAYFALLSADHLDIKPGGNAQDTRWFQIDTHRVRESLAFDHAEILKAAVTRLRDKVEYTSLPVFLMPEEFTLTELQQMYEVVLGRQLEKKAFRTRFMSAELIEQLPKMKSGANRPAQLYRLKPRQQLYLFSRPFGSAHSSL